MRLLYAHDHYFYNYNGTIYSNGSFSKEVMDRYTSVFNKVTFVSRQKKISEEPDNLSLSSHPNVNYVPVPNFKSIKTYSLKPKARKIIKKELLKCDYVIARLPSEIGYLAVEMAKKHGKPYLIEIVTCPWDAYWNHSLTGKVIAPFQYIKLKKVAKFSKFTIYVTNNFLQDRYPTRGYYESCSNVLLKDVDDEVLLKRLEKINAMTSKQKIIIGTTAAIDVKFKGQQYVIKALGKLKRKGIDNIEYQLVGGGYSDYLKKIAKRYNVENQVIFKGTKSHDDVFEWLKNIDLYVQPSRQEGLPRALIEAMSVGLPAFGANTAGIPELLDKKFIFSNTRHNIDEIIEILQLYNKDNMAQQARINHEKSKEYLETKINRKRKSFFEKFIEYGGDL